MKKVIGLLGLIGVFLSGGIGSIFADDVDLERIVVTPSRIEENYGNVSRKIDVVTSGDMELSSTNNLAGALTEITSVNISDYGGTGASKNIRMRGSSAAQVLVMVDGMPANSPRDGAVDLSSMPLDNIDRVEVLHGAASSLYGSQAMAGVVNIITKNPPKDKPKTELSSSFGTFRTYTERFSHGATLSKFGYLISGQYQNSEGFRENSKFDAKDVNTKLLYELNSSNNLTLKSGFYRGKLGTPGQITSVDYDDRQVNSKRYVDFNWDLLPDDSMGISTKIYNNYDKLEFIENTPGSIFDAGFSKAVHTTKVTGINWQVNKEISQIYHFITGFNYVGNSNNSTSSAKHHYTVRAVYLENQFEMLDEALEISLGARIDDYSNFGTETSPNVSFFYKFVPKAKLHGMLGKSFRAPTFNDLYWPDEGWSKGNPNLGPEKGITGELGIEAKLNKYILTDITYYRNDFNELINWAESAGVWQPTNIDSSVVDGVEFANTIYLMNNFELGLDYTFMRAKNDKTNKYLIYQPRHKIDSVLRYNNLDGFIFEVKGQFTGTRFHDTDNLIKVKQFFVMGISASKKFNPALSGFASIDNILNRKYQVLRNYPLPGFSITGGLKLEF